MSQSECMSKEEQGIIKASAAARYRELNIRPATADYIFERFIAKQAKARDPRITKLAARLKQHISTVRSAGNNSK